MKYNKLLSLFLIAGVLLIGQVSFASFSTEAQAQYNKGIDFYKAGQIEESVNCFKQAISLNPNYIDAYYNLGSIMEYLNNDEEALNAFKQIILRKPDDYESVYKAAEISYRLGQNDRALMYLTLIPKDSLIGQKAHQLTEEINSAPKTQIASEQEVKDSTSVQEQNTNLSEQNITSKSEEAADKIYDNISSPTGIVTDTFDNIYVADFADNLIYKIGKDNKKIVFIKSNKINGPIGLAIDNNNNIYIANYNKDNVLKVDSNGVITEFIQNIPKPYCMYITGNFLFVSSQGNNSVLRRKLVN